VIEDIELIERPRLSNPLFLAAWPGIGQVALIAVRYLREQLGAQEFARISPLNYFDPGGVFIEDNIIQSPRFPQSIFYYWRHPEGVQDMVIFEGEAQPTFHAYGLAHKVLDLAQSLGAGRVFTFAAALVSEFSESPRVWAAGTSPGLCRELERHGAILKGDFFIAGMNGVLLAVAQERGMEAACLLGETLRFFPQKDNPVASLAILEVFTGFLGLPVNLEGLRRSAEQARAELERLIRQSRREFIDRFTFPLWERGDEEEKA